MSAAAEVRPALVNVLAATVKLASVEVSVLDSALMGHVANLLARGDAYLTSSGIVGDASRWRGALAWRDVTPAEAVEMLATRGLWPWPVGDDPTRWWCYAECTEHEPMVGLYDCGGCGGSGYADGHTADPPTLAALVAVASLGAPTLLRVEELARVLVGRAPRVVFRIVARETARERHERTIGREPRATPAERDLAAIGLHVVGLDGDRVTLAVEAL